MKNNDVLRKLRYAFDFSDDNMIKLFKLGALDATRAEISDWLKKEDHEAYKPLNDRIFAHFLNGFIVYYRGEKPDAGSPEIEKQLNNNIILRKLKIALSLNDLDIVEIMGLNKFSVNKSEINAFFRNPSAPQYRECKDQFLRNFLEGLQHKHRK